MNTEWERHGREPDVPLTACYAGYVPPRGNNFHIVHRGEFSVRALAVATVHHVGNDFVVVNPAFSFSLSLFLSCINSLSPD